MVIKVRGGIISNSVARRRGHSIDDGEDELRYVKYIRVDYQVP